MVILCIVERDSQDEIEEIFRFYGREKVTNTIRNVIYFLPDYAIDSAIVFSLFKRKRINVTLLILRVDPIIGNKKDHF